MFLSSGLYFADEQDWFTHIINAQSIKKTALFIFIFLENFSFKSVSKNEYSFINKGKKF